MNRAQHIVIGFMGSVMGGLMVGVAVKDNSIFIGCLGAAMLVLAGALLGSAPPYDEN